MKKTLYKFIILSILLTANIVAFAQKDKGTVKYQIKSNYARMFASLDYINQQQKDKFLYVWESRSDDNLYAELYFTSNKSLYKNLESDINNIDDRRFSRKKENIFYLNDYQNQTIHYAVTLNGKPTQIIDSLQSPKWKILNDIKEVAGEICMNATFYDSIKRQNIVAWFALNVPSQAGPAQFRGLPGLILEVNINKGAKIYSAQSLKFEDSSNNIVLPEKIKGKEITYSYYLNQIKETIQDRVQSQQPWFWTIDY